MQYLLTLSFVRSALSVSVSMSLYGAVLTRTSSTDKPRATRSTWERSISASNCRQNNSALTFPDSAFNAGDVQCCKNPQTIRNPNQSGCRRCRSWRVSWWAGLINSHLHLQILLILKPTKGCDWWRGLAVRQWGGVCVCVWQRLWTDVSPDRIRSSLGSHRGGFQADLHSCRINFKWDTLNPKNCDFWGNFCHL